MKKAKTNQNAQTTLGSRRIIPYGRQYIDDDDIAAVSEILRSDYLTTGPAVGHFEQVVSSFCETENGIAFSSGTAALHAAMFALGIGPGDEVIVPTMTFAASANCVLYLGGRPVFADVSPDTLLISPESAEKLITPNTKAIIGVDYAGQPCEWDNLRMLAKQNNLYLIADSCHALGASLDNQSVGTLADMTIFSFHPVKHVATGEGGMVLTNSKEFKERLALFRNHGITTDIQTREKSGNWFYEMTELGFNYRLTDIQAALGISQMTKLPHFLKKRREIAEYYDEKFQDSIIRPLSTRKDIQHAYHLYVVRIPNRNSVFDTLRTAGIYTQVHYIPVHLHPFYQEKHGTKAGLCPSAEAAYEEILSLPMFPDLSHEEQQYVVDVIMEAV